MNLPVADDKVLWDIMIEEWNFKNPKHQFQSVKETGQEFWLFVGNNGLYPPVAYIADEQKRVVGSFELLVKEPKSVNDIRFITIPSSEVNRNELLKLLQEEDEYAIPVWKSLLVRWDETNPKTPVWKWDKFRRLYDTEYRTA